MTVSRKPPVGVADLNQYDGLSESLPQSIPSVIERRRKALTADDLAELLPIKRDTFLQWAREGRIPAMRVNGCVLFDPKTVAAWLRERMTTAA